MVYRHDFKNKYYRNIREFNSRKFSLVASSTDLAKKLLVCWSPCISYKRRTLSKIWNSRKSTYFSGSITNSIFWQESLKNWLFAYQVGGLFSKDFLLSESQHAELWSIIKLLRLQNRLFPNEITNIWNLLILITHKHLDWIELKFFCHKNCLWHWFLLTF